MKNIFLPSKAKKLSIFGFEMKSLKAFRLGQLGAFRDRYLAALLVSALVLGANNISAQTQPLQKINAHGYEWRGGAFDSLFNPPQRADTNFSIFYKPNLRSGSFFWDSLLNVQWRFYNGAWHTEPVSGGGGGGSTDSVILITNPLAKQNWVRSAHNGDTLYAYGVKDTLGLTWKAASDSMRYVRVEKAVTPVDSTNYKLLVRKASDSSFAVMNWPTFGSGGGFTDPMTTAYDIIYRNGSNTTTRLGKGADGTFLGVQGGVVAYYSPPTNALVKTVTSPSSNTTVSVSSGDHILNIEILPSSNLTAFKVGTSSGADDVVPTTAVSSSNGATFFINATFSSATTLYIQGITSSTSLIVTKY